MTSREHSFPGRERCSRPGVLVIALVGAVLAFVLVAPGALAQRAATSMVCSADHGQALIEAGRYEHAIRAFSCLVAAQPTEIEGYRGRAEAALLLGRYADALADYARITAAVEPVHPDALRAILAGYDARLAAAPESVPALTGASFARWVDFQYNQAIHILDTLLELRPDDPYANLFRGSSRLLQGVTKARGAEDLERAIDLAPESPDVRWIVADAYTYGRADLPRAFAEASRALEWGLDTPRVHAILGAAHNGFGELEAAAGHIARHIDLVTAELVTTAPLAAGESRALGVVPGRVYEIPVPAIGGETLSIATSSKDYWDTIAVLLAPDGTPVLGSDDAAGYFAAFDWVAPASATYRLRVTFFESVNFGELVVTRK